jgi:HK97 family phage prohead protease
MTTALRAPSYWPAPPRAGVRTMMDRACQYENLGKFVTGIAIPYGDVATLGDGTLERIEPGAFGASFADVYATLNHNVHEILGRVQDDTLSLWDDVDGIHFLLDPESAHAQPHQLRQLLRHGFVTGASFRMCDKTVVSNTRDQRVTTVLQATLVDVSVLTSGRAPSYRKTRVRFTRDRLAE